MKGPHCIALAIATLASATAFGQVPYDRIVKAESEPANWLTYAGSYKSQRYTALDAKSGAVRWDVAVDDNHLGYYLTLAPLAIDGKIIVGVSGAEAGIRGFVDAYDAKTGRRVWRRHTVPAPGEPGSNTWGGDSWK